ncbi:DUF222 domain-containing protein [Leifsonia sp. NPDC058248]|uniref:DUF222 domain-containing protein n=1 Tax=Leifsonia sp. NPDC058248 TaxID=3346402 RepID=UPI0036DBBB22
MSTSPAPELRDLLAEDVAGFGAEFAAKVAAEFAAKVGATFASPGRFGRDELLLAVTSLGDLQSVLDAAKVRIAGELVRRSAAPDDENPVRRSGHASPPALLAERWRIALPAARQLCRVGASTSTQRSLLGESLPARYPLLAEALIPASSDGDHGFAAPSRVSVDQAAVIVRELDKAAPSCSREALALGEKTLVEHAPGLTVEDVRVLAGQVRDRLDQDGVEPREDRQRRRRSLTISTTTDGMTHLDWFLDPESAGFVVTAIDAVVGHELRAVRFRPNTPDLDDETGTGDVPESRSLAQFRSDAATDVFRHAAACTTPAGTGKPPVTMIVRISLDTLRTGTGTGEIDGIRTPISARTARRLAVDAQLIPAVLAGPSEILDLGRARRLFTPTQKLALAERDGGCAFPGCPHPPSYTEAHHIRWWDAHTGPTDLSNGILLCSHHHHRVHADHWDIHLTNGTPHFTPPAHIDPHRTPRPGGRIHLPERTAAPPQRRAS